VTSLSQQERLALEEEQFSSQEDQSRGPRLSGDSTATAGPEARPDSED